MTKQAKVEKLEKENKMQDLTIGALKAMTSERFTSIEKNLEVINSGNERGWTFQNHIFYWNCTQNVTYFTNKHWHVFMS